MNAKDFLKSKGEGESPYGDVIWNFNKASNEWLADLLEEFLQLNNSTEVIKRSTKTPHELK